MGEKAIKQQSTKQEWTKKWQKSKDKEFTWDGCFDISLRQTPGAGSCCFPVILL